MGFVDSAISDNRSSMPDADGDWIVWRSLDSALESQVHLRNVYQGVTRDISEEVGANTATNFSVDDGELAYEGAVGAEIWVKYWDETEVHEIEEGTEPSLSDGRVAYNVWNGDWDVHYWDGSTIHQIAVNQTHDAQPSLDGDWLVWVGHPDGNDEDSQIFYMRVRDSNSGG
jgi:hypothetical protein